MGIVLWLVIALVPCLLGMGGLRVLYGKEYRKQNGLSDIYVTGWIVCIGLGALLHIMCVLAGFPFSFFVKWYGVLTGVMALSVLLFLVMSRKRVPKQKTGEAKKLALGEEFWFLLFALLVLVQIVLLFGGKSVYQEGDLTPETVNTFLVTDRIWEINPLTGREYQAGMPFRLKILVLPSLYGALCKLSGLPIRQVLEQWMPVIWLIAGYLVYGSLADRLFEGNRKRKGLFLFVTALLISLGTYMDVMDGFGIFYAGYRGTTLRNLVLVPYTISCCLNRKWRSAILCILAEACIVWTLYGMGICFLTVMLFGAIGLWQKRFPDKEAVCKSF